MDWILSHPIPVLFLACVVGIAVGWNALERQNARQLAVAGAIVVIGAALAALAWAIDTPSECAERTVMAFIERAVAADAVGAARHLAPDALIHFGGFNQPGMDRPEIDRDLASLQTRHRVNAHTNLRVATAGTGEAQIVEVACLTETQSSPGRVLTAWSFRVQRDPDARWRIHAISFDLLAGSAPRPGIF
jgi:hypothetical protein